MLTSYPSTGPDSSRSSPLPCGTPSTTSTSTTSANSLPAMRSAQFAPTFPAPTTVTFFRMNFQGRATRVALSSEALQLTLLRFEWGQAGLQAAHPSQPAVVVFGFAAHVLHNLGMRNNQEALSFQSLNHGSGHFFGRDRVVQQERSAAEFGAFQHARPHPHGTKRRDLDPLIAIGDAEPFGQAERGMFGDGIGR